MYSFPSPPELETRCPRGQKTVLYRKAKLEKFAEYLNQDGLVSRLTTYGDAASEYGMTRGGMGEGEGGGARRSGGGEGEEGGQGGLGVGWGRGKREGQGGLGVGRGEREGQGGLGVGWEGQAAKLPSAFLIAILQERRRLRPGTPSVTVATTCRPGWRTLGVGRCRSASGPADRGRSKVGMAPRLRASSNGCFCMSSDPMALVLLSPHVCRTRLLQVLEG